MKNKKILITGSSGQSGREIAGLLSNKYEIAGVDKVQGEFTTIIQDLTDWEKIKEITKGVSAIIHTASLHAPHIHTHSRERFIDTNIKGTLYLLEASKINNVQKFIYTSTTSIYGESMNSQDKAIWITEEVETRPRDIYDITKIAAEQLCKDFFDSETLCTTSLRVSRFWDEPLEKKVFYRMYRGLDVRDVAHAHELALALQTDWFEVFNISAQSIFQQDDLFDLKNNLFSLLSKRIPQLIELYDTKGWVLPESIDRVYVIEKAQKVLNFNPAYNIDELIRQIIRNTAG